MEHTCRFTMEESYSISVKKKMSTLGIHSGWRKSSFQDCTVPVLVELNQTKQCLSWYGISLAVLNRRMKWNVNYICSHLECALCATLFRGRKTEFLCL